MSTEGKLAKSQDDLRTAARDRDWEQLHTPKNAWRAT